MTTLARPLSSKFMDRYFYAVPTLPSDAEAYRGALPWCADDSAKGSWQRTAIGNTVAANVQSRKQGRNCLR